MTCVYCEPKSRMMIREWAVTAIVNLVTNPIGIAHVWVVRAIRLVEGPLAGDSSLELVRDVIRLRRKLTTPKPVERTAAMTRLWATIRRCLVSSRKREAFNI